MSLHISASLLNDYLKCERQAYYRIFEKDKGETNKYMRIGIAVHIALENFWNNKDKAIKCIKVHYGAYKGELSKKDYNSMVYYINSYFDNFNKFMSKDDEIEKNFKVKLYDDVYLVGKFDRISNGVIYDWKTSSRVPRNLSNDPQFIVYYDAYTRIYGKKPNAVFLASLSKGELIPYEYNKFYYNQLFDDVIINLIKDIKNKYFIKDGLFRGACKNCQYKRDCLKGLNEDAKELYSGEFAS